MTEKEFIEIAQKAIDSGFRKCYIAKVKAQLLFKGNIYFNMSGIYKYEKWSFKKLGDLTKENLKKFTSIYSLFEETKKGNLEPTPHLKEVVDKIKEEK